MVNKSQRGMNEKEVYPKEEEASFIMNEKTKEKIIII
jgi:hypothetical protein